MSLVWRVDNLRYFKKFIWGKQCLRSSWIVDHFRSFNGSDLGPDCLQRLSVDGTSRHRVTLHFLIIICISLGGDIEPSVRLLNINSSVAMHRLVEAARER